jgi:hypothetical protein
MLQSRIWTSDRLQQRQWHNNYFCAFCCRSLEMANHLFQECPVTRLIWTAISRWSSSLRLLGARWRTGVAMQDWFLSLSGGIMSVKARGMKWVIALVCWTIWRERNARIFNGEEETVPRLITEIKDEAVQWFAGAKKLRTDSWAYLSTGLAPD